MVSFDVIMYEGVLNITNAPHSRSFLLGKARLRFHCYRVLKLLVSSRYLKLYVISNHGHIFNLHELMNQGFTFIAKVFICNYYYLYDYITNLSCGHLGSENLIPGYSICFGNSS